MTDDDDFRLELEVDAPIARVWDALTTADGIRSWWTANCDMDARVGGKASFRFPKAGFHADVRITRLEPPHLVEWEVVDSKHPESAGFMNLRDWEGTRIRFALVPLGPERTRLELVHEGLAALECLEVCERGWNFFVGRSLRGRLERGAGQPELQ
jgi:uncharacterized protein YndB with AHSA1/START domain